VYEELTGDQQATLRKMDEVLGIMEPLERELEAETIPAEVAKMVQDRETARENNDFALADKLRQQIQKRGYIVEDTKKSTVIRRL